MNTDEIKAAMQESLKILKDFRSDDERPVNLDSTGDRILFLAILKLLAED